MNMITLTLRMKMNHKHRKDDAVLFLITLTTTYLFIHPVWTKGVLVSVVVAYEDVNLTGLTAIVHH